MSIEISSLKIDDKTVLGVKITLQKSPLLILVCEKGYLMCGYLDVSAANSVGDIAVKVRGVGSFDDMLRARVVEVSREAEKLGIKVGMTGEDALRKMT